MSYWNFYFRIPLVLDLVLNKTLFTFVGHIFFKELCFEILRDILDFRIRKVVKCLGFFLV